jgi:hypothetical protein
VELAFSPLKPLVANASRGWSSGRQPVIVDHLSRSPGDAPDGQRTSLVSYRVGPQSSRPDLTTHQRVRNSVIDEDPKYTPKSPHTASRPDVEQNKVAQPGSHDSGHGDDTRTAKGSGGQSDKSEAELMIGDIVDLEAPGVLRANAFARALVTARLDEDLGNYIDLLAQLKSELAPSDCQSRPDVEYVLGIVGSLALIASVVVRSAERAGVVSEQGQPLLVELFDFLTTSEARL